MMFPDAIEPQFPDSTEPTLADYKPYSVAWIIQRVIEDIAANPEMKQIGVSQMYALRRPSLRLSARW